MKNELDKETKAMLEGLIGDFSFLTSMIYDLSIKFEGVKAPERVALSTYFLGHIFDCSFSTLALLPYNEHSKIDEENFDIFFHLSIFRNIIEAINNMYYFSLEQITPDEEKFRSLLFEIHLDSEAKKIASLLGFNQTLKEIDEEKVEERKEEMRNNSFFKSLNLGLQKELLQGKRYSHLTQYDLAEKRGMKKDYFNGIYKFLSGYTHSVPIAINTFVTSKIQNFSKNFYATFLALILQSINWSISDMLLRMGDLWGYDIARKDSLEIVFHYYTLYHEDNQE